MISTPSQKAVFDGCFLFRGAEGEREALLGAAHLAAFGKGESIYSPGHFRKALGIVLSGRAVVRKENGVLLNQLGPGDCFGVAALFAEDEFVTVVEARSRAQVAFVPAQALAEAFARCPAMALNHIAFLSRRIQFLNRKIDSFTTPSAEAGLVLWVLGHMAGGQAAVSGGYAGLARELNVSRASLYRALDRLAAKGLLQKQERTLLIPNGDALRRYAETHSPPPKISG